MVSKTGKKEILYVAAFDKNGVLVKAKDAEKTEDYFCPECKEKLILKKSGKTGKGSKRPHYAHYSQSPNCTPEGVLHKSFKLLVLQYIHTHIANKTPIGIEWECPYCHTKHTGNLLQYAADVQEEYHMEKCRADIALLGQEGKPFAVIEIVVTHKPEDTAIAYYKENKIILIQIELNSEDDIDNIETLTSKPTSIDYCFNRLCPNIGEYIYIRQPVPFDKKCGYHSMRTCIAQINHYFGLYPSTDLTDDEIEYAKNNGVKFEGRTVICPHCKSIRQRTMYRRPSLRF